MRTNSLTCCMIMLLMMLCTQATAKVFLVAAGITDYPGTINDLNCPANDARTVVELYKENAHQNNTSLSYVILTNQEATKSKILAAMKKVYRQAGENDLVVFFFSGHGYHNGFCPYDGHLSYSEVRNAMKVTNCNKKMVFADACFSGGMRKDGQTNRRSAAEASEHNVMLFLSSADGEESYDGLSERENGVFTTFLVSALRGSADVDGNHTVTAWELFSYVSNGIKGLPLRQKQTPKMFGKFDRNMPVMTWKN